MSDRFQCLCLGMAISYHGSKDRSFLVPNLSLVSWKALTMVIVSSSLCKWYLVLSWTAWWPCRPSMIMMSTGWETPYEGCLFRAVSYP